MSAPFFDTQGQVEDTDWECPECGDEVASDDIICKSCGAEFTDDLVEETEDEFLEDNSEPQAPTSLPQTDGPDVLTVLNENIAYLAETMEKCLINIQLLSDKIDSIETKEPRKTEKKKGSFFAPQTEPDVVEETKSKSSPKKAPSSDREKIIRAMAEVKYIGVKTAERLIDVGVDSVEKLAEVRVTNKVKSAFGRVGDKKIQEAKADAKRLLSRKR